MATSKKAAPKKAAPVKKVAAPKKAAPVKLEGKSKLIFTGKFPITVPA